MDFSSVVLAGILPNNKQSFYIATEKGVTGEHFASAYHRTIWDFISKAYDKYAAIPSSEVFADFAVKFYSKKKEDKSAVLVMEWDKLVSHQVAEADFLYAVEQILDIRTQRKTGEVIAKGFEILEEGLVIDGVRLEGQEAARSFIVSEMSKIDSSIVSENAPEGDLRTETGHILQDYDRRRDEPEKFGGVKFGFSQLDDNMGGLMPGELCLIAAFTGQGKSHLVTQLAWNAAVKQGKNFYLSTSETVRDQFMVRLIARHSREPQFGIPDGLNAKKITYSTLDDREYQIFQNVLEDIHDNPDYGSWYVAQIPSGASLAFIEGRVRSYMHDNPLDLLLVDSLNLLSPLSKRGTEREELNDTLRRAKSFSTELGIPLVSPWQIKRESFASAATSNSYGLSSLSDTSEAEKSSSQIITILRPDNDDNAAVIQVIKNRAGESVRPETLYIDYRNSYFGVPPKQHSTSSGGVFEAFRR